MNRPYLDLGFEGAMTTERLFQINKHGVTQDRLQVEWLAILLAELGEVAEEVKDINWHLPSDSWGLHEQFARLRSELIQVATVCMAWDQYNKKEGYYDPQ